DILTGEHYRDEYTSINPSRLVPTLEEGPFRLTESSAILKYLASRFEAPEYPCALEPRAKVDEAMDWFNTQLYKDFVYDFVYPQVLPHHRRPTAEHQAATLARAREKAMFWFEVLDRHILGTREYVANDKRSIADYLGGCFVAAGELVDCHFDAYPNVRRWLGSIKSLPSWSAVSAELCRFAVQVKGTKRSEEHTSELQS